MFKKFFVFSGASSSWATSTSCGTGDWGIIVQQEQIFPRSETWINLAPLKLLWDLDPALVDLAGDVGAPFGHGPVLGPANVRTYSSPEVRREMFLMQAFQLHSLSIEATSVIN